MPHATCKYRFEFKVFAWASTFSERLTGHPHYPFFISFAQTGAPREIIFGVRPEQFGRGDLEQLKEESPSWLFYDPFDGPVCTYIEWADVDRETLERLVTSGTGERFEPADFGEGDDVTEFPGSWSVMF